MFYKSFGFLNKVLNNCKNIDKIICKNYENSL